MKKLLLLFCVLLSGFFGFSQFKASLELRPRMEYDHGYKSLYNHDRSAAISQRSRLSLDYSMDKLKVRLSLQDVRFWGDTKSLNVTDDKFSVHEAWAEILFSEAVSLKLGRQELVYDDHRIFGSVNWTQQARSHDLALLKWKTDEEGKLHLGVAYNSESLTYKYMQFMWYHRDMDKVSFSLLALNNGVKDINDDTHYSQTLGTHVTVKPGKPKFSGSFYYQLGDDKFGNDISAYQFMVRADIPFDENWGGNLGFEQLSGTDVMNDTKNKSFTPLYGTNHKFNGWMDYFYVGNHMNNVGLSDAFAGISFKKDKWNFGLTGHYFAAAADLYGLSTEAQDKYLGTEMDFSVGYKFAKETKFVFGYSHMFGSDSMEILKGGDKGALNGWAWLMIAVKPTLFSTAQKK